MLNAIRYERANFLHGEFQFGDMHAQIVDDFHFLLRSFLEFFYQMTQQVINHRLHCTQMTPAIKRKLHHELNFGEVLH